MALSLSLVTQLLGGSASGSSAADAGTAVLNLRRALAPGAEAKGVAQEKKDPVTISAIAQFKSALANAKTLDQALADPRVQAVLLPAVGLASQQGNTGLIKQALKSDPNDPNGLAARLGANFQNAAATLNLKKDGLAGLQNKDLQEKLINGYIQYQYRTGLDEQTTGLSDALYFVEQATGAKDIYDVLGNSVFRRVVSKAFGLPDQVAIQSVETQARAFSSRVNLDKLQDPKEVRKIADRYLVAVSGNGGNANLFLNV